MFVFRWHGGHRGPGLAGRAVRGARRSLVAGGETEDVGGVFGGGPQSSHSHGEDRAADPLPLGVPVKPRAALPERGSRRVVIQALVLRRGWRQSVAHCFGMNSKRRGVEADDADAPLVVAARRWCQSWRSLNARRRESWQNRGSSWESRGSSWLDRDPFAAVSGERAVGRMGNDVAREVGRDRDVLHFLLWAPRRWEAPRRQRPCFAGNSNHAVPMSTILAARCMEKWPIRRNHPKKGS